MAKQTISTDKAPAAIGPYSQATVAPNGMVFVSGQIPLDAATGQLVGEGDAPAQARKCLENVTAVLQAAGCSLADVLKVTVFLKDMGQFATVNEVYGEFFKENPPARAAVEVARLPKDVQVEIEAIAIKP